ncbi:GGDEF domain-containing protein [Paraclostridium bifermentans]|uniref:GGDEF domain-containing protein n=1 Tax=Paraclostridium bifermentans TaxID=1490 RepID=UPI00189EF1D7|nr:GGDEF domain-containing protein [Paraclostridium bifermentans]
MEKIILRKIILNFTFIFMATFLVSVTVMFSIKNSLAKDDLSQMISQVEGTYDQSEEKLKSNEEVFKSYYLNRVYAIDYILSNNPKENLNIESLEKISQLMDIEAIYLIDNNGIIVLSDDESSIGLDLLNSKSAHKFWKLIKSNNSNDYVIDLDAISIIGNEEKIYIGIKSTLEDYSVIQIAVDREALKSIGEKDSIQYIIKSIPTIYERTIFIVNEETGSLEGITVNNEQDLVFDGIDNNKDFIKKLHDLTKASLAKINGKYRYVKTRIVGDYIIGGYIDADFVYNGLALEIIYLTLGILIVFLVMILIFKFIMKKYILTDIFSIGKNIKSLITGNYNIEFDVMQETELKEVARMLNYLKDSYKYKSERMTRIMSTISSHIAIFECLYLINRNFFSDNIQEILGLDDESWEEISKEPKKFQNYIESIEKSGSVVNVNNKFLSIVSFKKEGEFYGMILDKTYEEEARNRIEKISETDGLTKLLNRRGLENRLKDIFKSNNSNGVLIIFDLDNFKSVNDILGHPIGDEVLKIFSRCLTNSFRENDIISRIGGDEFVVFINKNMELDTLSKKLDGLLNNIRSDLNYYYKNYGLSTSIGVAYRDNHINTYEELYEEADKGLYKAKNLGKDGFYINNKK